MGEEWRDKAGEEVQLVVSCRVNVPARPVKPVLETSPLLGSQMPVVVAHVISCPPNSPLLMFQLSCFGSGDLVLPDALINTVLLVV